MELGDLITIAGSTNRENEGEIRLSAISSGRSREIVGRAHDAPSAVQTLIVRRHPQGIGKHGGHHLDTHYRLRDMDIGVVSFWSATHMLAAASRFRSSCSRMSMYPRRRAKYSVQYH